MASLAFHLFVGTVIFVLCSYGCNKCSQCSRLLICCRQWSIRLLWFAGGVFSTLCLQVGHRLRFWGGFSCFVCFIWCQLFACLIRAAIFRLPSTFAVWSFFLCHRHLWSVLSFLFSFFVTGICVQFLSYTAFSAIGIRARLTVFAFFLS